MTSSSVRGRISFFLRDTRGGVTVESVLWLPIFFAFLALAADGSVMFTKRAMALRVVQDANRGFVVGRFGTDQEAAAAQAEAWVLASLSTISPNATAQTQAVGDIVSTRVEMPTYDLDAVGILGLLSGFNVAIQAEQLLQD